MLRRTNVLIPQFDHNAPNSADSVLAPTLAFAGRSAIVFTFGHAALHLRFIPSNDGVRATPGSVVCGVEAMQASASNAAIFAADLQRR